MERGVFIVGVDPGLAHLGLALVRLLPEGIEVVRRDLKPVMLCIETTKSDKKRAVKASDDNTRRAREVFTPLVEIFSSYDIKVICTEAMSFPRSSSASHKMGISWGLIVALSCLYHLPIVQASPQEIKKAVCGRAEASKLDIQNALAQKHNISPELFTKVRREHPFDALAAVEACLESEVIRMARSIAV